MVKKPRIRRVTHRQPRINPKMDALATTMLDQAQQLFDEVADLDTAVRDIIYEGLARIVYAAFDTRACAQCVSDFDSVAYIQTKTYEWFREREFVEWFCAGASTLFRNSPREFHRIKIARGKGVTKLTAEKVG